MKRYLSVGELDRLWALLECERGDTLRLLCEYREEEAPTRRHRAAVLEINEPEASQVRLTLADEPTLDSKLKVGGFKQGDGERPVERYQEAWSKVLVACFLATPSVDPMIFGQLLGETQSLKLYFDTNVLASGVAHWVLEVFRGRVHIETSVVVDRELMRWIDREGELDFYRATQAKHFLMRTQWRLARQILAARLDGAMVMRPVPDQSALMLAKFRDEHEGKSPDADMLLLAQAQRQIAEQPRNARTMFLTGDRNLANTAAGILGAGSVLYISADPKKIAPFYDKVCLRGWWEEDGALGRLHVPPWSHLVRGLLAACHRLVFERYRGGEKEAVWTLCQQWHHGLGVPSDWSDPVFCLEREWSRDEVQEALIAQLAEDTPPAEQRAEQALPVAAVREEVLWPWGDVEDGSLGMTSWRLSAQSFMEGLEALVVRGDAGPVMEAAGHARRSAYKVFEVLGWMTQEGRPGPHHGWLVEAWRRGDLDALHKALRKLKVYERAVVALDGGEGEDEPEIVRTWANVVVSLGQASERGGRRYRGDAALSAEELDEALARWMPQRGASMSAREVSERALLELSVSAYRLDRVMGALRQREPLRWELSTDGEFVEGSRERVVRLRQGGYDWEEVNPAGLTFGGPQPTRMIRRTA